MCFVATATRAAAKVRVDGFGQREGWKISHYSSTAALRDVMFCNQSGTIATSVLIVKCQSHHRTDSGLVSLHRQNSVSTATKLLVVSCSFGLVRQESSFEVGSPSAVFGYRAPVIREHRFCNQVSR